MLNQSIQTVLTKLSQGVIIAGFFFAPALIAKDVPLSKIIEINIPFKEYSIVDFPFKIKKTQFNSFVKKGMREKKKKKEPAKVLPNSTKKINLNKKNATLKPKPKANILGLEQGVNVLTFKPIYKGSFEMIVWGYSKFPMMVKVNIVSADDSDKYIHFVELTEDKKTTKEFESKPHEKVIEQIMQYLYDKNNRKPSGYNDIIRREEHYVDILNYYHQRIGRVVVSLGLETRGRIYMGQVWNVNLQNIQEIEDIMGTRIKNKDNHNNHNIYEPFVVREITGNKLPDNFILDIYPELFDANGVYGISPEAYEVTLQQGTRVMIVRSAH